MTREVRLMVGIPASGKSTFIEKEVAYLEDDHRTVAVISRDNVRKTLLGVSDESAVSEKTYFSKEKEVFKEFIRQINEAMELGIDTIFIDATHINPASRYKTLSKLRPDPRTNLVIEILPIKTETAIERNKKRTGFARVPDSAIKDMQKNFKMPTSREFAGNTYGFRTVVLRCHGEE